MNLIAGMIAYIVFALVGYIGFAIAEWSFWVGGWSVFSRSLFAAWCVGWMIRVIQKG